jgi:hypothetical protein
MTMFFTDGYRDLPPQNNPRAVLTHELHRVKMMSWADPGDAELRQMIAELEAQLRAFDSKGGAS